MRPHLKYFSAGSCPARGPGDMTANRWRLVGVRPISFAAARICANNAAFIVLGLFSNCANNSINTRAIGLSAREIQGSGRMSSSHSSRRRPVSFFSGSMPLSCVKSIGTSAGIGRRDLLPVTTRRKLGKRFRPRTAMHTPLVSPGTYCVTAQISNRVLYARTPPPIGPPQSS